MSAKPASEVTAGQLLYGEPGEGYPEWDDLPSWEQLGYEQKASGQFADQRGKLLAVVKSMFELAYTGTSPNEKLISPRIMEDARNAIAKCEAATEAGSTAATFQRRIAPWMQECFGAAISADRMERNHRFFEEATELVQACGCTASEAHQLVDYVFGRPQGDAIQEVGGVMVTLAALCLAQGIDMHDAGEIELARIWTKVEQIRAKQASKPAHSPLPQHRSEHTPQQIADHRHEMLAAFKDAEEYGCEGTFVRDEGETPETGFWVRSEQWEGLRDLMGKFELVA